MYTAGLKSTIATILALLLFTLNLQTTAGEKTVQGLNKNDKKDYYLPGLTNILSNDSKLIDCLDGDCNLKNKFTNKSLHGRHLYGIPMYKSIHENAKNMFFTSFTVLRKPLNILNTDKTYLSNFYDTIDNAVRTVIRKEYEQFAFNNPCFVKNKEKGYYESIDYGVYFYPTKSSDYQNQSDYMKSLLFHDSSKDDCENNNSNVTRPNLSSLYKVHHLSKILYNLYSLMALNSSNHLRLILNGSRKLDDEIKQLLDSPPEKKTLENENNKFILRSIFNKLSQTLENYCGRDYVNSINSDLAALYKEKHNTLGNHLLELGFATQSEYVDNKEKAYFGSFDDVLLDAQFRLSHVWANNLLSKYAPELMLSYNDKLYQKYNTPKDRWIADVNALSSHIQDINSRPMFHDKLPTEYTIVLYELNNSPVSHMQKPYFNYHNATKLSECDPSSPLDPVVKYSMSENNITSDSNSHKEITISKTDAFEYDSFFIETTPYQNLVNKCRDPNYINTKYKNDINTPSLRFICTTNVSIMSSLAYIISFNSFLKDNYVYSCNRCVEGRLRQKYAHFTRKYDEAINKTDITQDHNVDKGNYQEFVREFSDSIIACIKESHADIDKHVKDNKPNIVSADFTHIMLNAGLYAHNLL